MSITIHVNGEDRDVRENLSITELLIELNIDSEQSGIAIALDREVIPKSAWKTTEVLEDSEVEIIRAVQGG